ncbi:porin family protein [Agrobacterium tumefaciens]|uniref:outer membrane protein n=1 Tax=Agrobacterium tumefaciens TaxID=358 RepID=UPI0012B83D2A|nr:outer membrane protein [Agrobacterium tumefaciens]MQB07312.1 porin family protein [Agrobacterium tumefaciens]
MHFKTIAFAVLAVSVSLPAAAADMTLAQPSPQLQHEAHSAFDWSGFYLGGQGGYTWNQATVFGSAEDLDSGSAGLHAGYNFQSGAIVYGIENDFNYNFENKGEANLEWDASARGRVGYALDRTLVFATAGVAAAGVKVDVPEATKNDAVFIGWTAGGGVEHAFTDNIALRGEYRYSDFGSKDFGSTVGEFKADQHKVVVGASYKF